MKMPSASKTVFLSSSRKKQICSTASSTERYLFDGPFSSSLNEWKLVKVSFSFAACAIVFSYVQKRETIFNLYLTFLVQGVQSYPGFHSNPIINC